MTTTTADAAAVPEHTTGEDRLMAHSYDGIREYDNPLPGWWRAIFWGSIVFAAGYFVWFQVAGLGETPEQKYKAALAEYQAKKDMRDADDASSVTEDMLKRLVSEGSVADKGAQVFATRCASCHGPDGRGLIGPNLTDSFELHGSSRVDIYRTVRGGVPGTAMPAWGEQLTGGEVLAAAAYAISLRGTNVTGGKAPQGQPVPAWDR